MQITVLHPGNMGAALGARLRTAGHTVRWHPPGRSQATVHRADRAAMTPTHDFDDLMAHTDLIISICPVAAATPIATAVAQSRFRGVYVEANAIGPERMRDIDHLLSAAGITVVDAAIAGSPPTDTGSPVIYLAGLAGATAPLNELFTAAGLFTRVISRPSPAASALKLALISVQRSQRLLAAIAHGIADAHAITDHLLAEAQRLGLDAVADRDGLSSVGARAWRWQHEMGEISAELARLALPTELAETSAALFERLADLKDQWHTPAEEVIARLARSGEEDARPGSAEKHESRREPAHIPLPGSQRSHARRTRSPAEDGSTPAR